MQNVHLCDVSHFVASVPRLAAETGELPIDEPVAKSETPKARRHRRQQYQIAYKESSLVISYVLRAQRVAARLRRHRC